MIEVANLTKYFSGFTAVDNISFNVKKGEIFAFLGPNGAGKTTTIKMLTSLLPPDSGNIIINGYDVQKEKLKARKSFGIVFQDQSLDDELTAWENMEFHGVLYGVEKKPRRRNIKDLLDMVGLSDKKDSFVKTFSGGMKRRLEVARGLLHAPEIIFLDEPTLGLDPQTRNKIWNYIKKLNSRGQVTVFFTTHYMEEAAAAAGRIAVIDRGKIIIDGPLDHLLEKTSSGSLEEAFLKMTGKDIRDESANPVDAMRRRRKMWHK